MISNFTKIVYLILFFLLSPIFLSSCTHPKQIVLPNNIVIIEINGNTKIIANNILYPRKGSIRGFMITPYYFYGWHNVKGSAIKYFLLNLSTSDIIEGDFHLIKSELSKNGLSMVDMSNELTYSLFMTKDQNELNQILMRQQMKITKAYGKYYITSY